MSEITALAKALVKAQADIKMPKLDGEGNFHNKFASLQATRDAIIPAMNAQGLSVVQGFVPQEDGIGVSTKVIHESGEMLDCGIFYIPVAQKDAQKYCAASTYARRFALQALACVVGSEDDNGASAVEEPVVETPKAEPPKASGQTKVQIDFLKSCGEAKKLIGKKPYYKLLGELGFAKSSEVGNKDDRANVLTALRAHYELNKA